MIVANKYFEWRHFYVALYLWCGATPEVGFSTGAIRWRHIQLLAPNYTAIKYRHGMDGATSAKIRHSRPPHGDWSRHMAIEYRHGGFTAI